MRVKLIPRVYIYMFMYLIVNTFLSMTDSQT